MVRKAFKWLKRSIALILIVGVVVSIAVFVAFPRLAKSQGIEYTALQFHFPSSIEIQNLKFENETVLITSGSAQFEWSWTGLLRGKIVGEYLETDNLLIFIKDTPPDPTDTSHFQFSDIIPIHINRIHSVNATYRSYSGKDSTVAFLPQLYASNFKINSGIHADSLYCGNSILYQSLLSSDTTAKEDESFSFEHFQHISSGHLVFENTEIAVFEKEKSHSLTHLNLATTGINTKNPIDFKLNQLNFTYQDTLDFRASHDEFLLNEEGLFALNGLSIQIPGLVFNLNSSSALINEAYAFEFDIHDSKISSSWLDLFIDDSPLKDDVDIYFGGKLNWSQNTLNLDGFSVALKDRTKASATGQIAFLDSGTTLAIDLDNFESTLFELQDIFNQPAIEDQNDITISSSFSVHGTDTDFKLNGFTDLNQNHITFKGSRKSSTFNFNISTDELIPHTIVNSLPEELSITKLSLENKIQVDTAYSLKSIESTLAFDKLVYQDYLLENITTLVELDERNSSITLLDQDRNANLKLTTKDDIFKDDNIRYNGVVNAKIPRLTDLNTNAGKLNSVFSGFIDRSADDINFQLSTEGLRFVLSGNQKTYANNFDFNFKSESEGKLSTVLSSLSDTLFYFSGDSQFANWWETHDNLYTDLPKAQLNLKLEIDSVFMTTLFNENASFSVEKLKLRTQGDTIQLSLKSSNMQFEEYEIQHLLMDEYFFRNSLDGHLKIEEFNNPYSNLSKIAIELNTSSLKNSFANISLTVNTLDEDVAFGLEIEDRDVTVNVKFQEGQTLDFGNFNWSLLDNDGFNFSKDGEFLNGLVKIQNVEQIIELSTHSNQLDLDIDKMDAGVIYSVFVNDSNFTATADLKASYNFNTDSLIWQSKLNNIYYDTLQIGDFESNGSYAPEGLIAKNSLTGKSGKLELDLEKKKAPLAYLLQLDNFNLQDINPIIKYASEGLALSGILTGTVNGNYSEELNANGFLNLNAVEVTHHDYGIFASIPKDSIQIVNNQIKFNELKVFDAENNPLRIDGSFALLDKNEIDLSLKTDNFLLINKKEDVGDFWGRGSITSNISIQGNTKSVMINGTLDVKENASLNYKYKSSVSIDELSQEVVFISEKSNETNLKDKRSKTKNTNFLKWNLDVDISRTNAYILLDETTNDYVKLTAAGNLKLRTSANLTPNIYGEIKSTEGSIFYSAPMVSDLNLKILYAYMRFNGDNSNPIIAFKGTESFRVLESDITKNKSDKSRVPIDVIAFVDENTLSDFELSFDLKSVNSTAGSFIESLPADQHQVYATNLLVFGSLSGEGSSTSLMGGVVTKLNELTRRNIKKADLSFYADTEEKNDDQNNSANFSNQKVQKFGYNYSQNLFNEKIRVTLGGEMNFQENYDPNQKQFNPLENVQIDYILSKHPEFYITAKKHDSYRGAIDGQVDEYSLGFTYGIHFRNLFVKPKTNAKGPK